MKRKTLIAAALAAGSLMGMASVAQAVPAVVAPSGSYPGPMVNGYPAPMVYGQPVTVYQSYPNQVVLVQPAPPAPLHEAVPAPRQGYLWSPGHYVWSNGRYAWQTGQWVAVQPGHAWQAARWEQRADRSWHLLSGHWVRTETYSANDRGMRGPNRDRDRDGIRNADDNDRDGDGVVNWRDNYPNDPNRS